MRLHEEYIKRHNINVPVIFYSNRSSVILKKRERPYQWKIFSSSWKEPDRHPGYFVIKQSSVIHNGCNIDKFTDDNIKSKENCFFFWDEYERAILYFKNQFRLQGYYAVEYDDRILALWEMLLIVYDSFISTTMDLGFLSLIKDSLDETLELKKRMDYFEEAKEKLFKNEEIVDVWSYQLLPVSNKNSEWMIRFIND